jgi:hypothetical protein
MPVLFEDSSRRIDRRTSHCASCQGCGDSPSPTAPPFPQRPKSAIQIKTQWCGNGDALVLKMKALLKKKPGRVDSEMGTKALS